MNLPAPRHRRALAWVALAVYLAVFLKLAIFRGASWSSRMWPLGDRVRMANVIPLRTIAFYLDGGDTHMAALRNLAGNVLAFLPAGILLPVLFPRLRRMRALLAAAFGASLTVEVVQLLTGFGRFDVDDILLNVVGAAIGWAVWAVAARLGRAADLTAP